MNQLKTKTTILVHVQTAKYIESINFQLKKLLFFFYFDDLLSVNPSTHLDLLKQIIDISLNNNDRNSGHLYFVCIFIYLLSNVHTNIFQNSKFIAIFTYIYCWLSTYFFFLFYHRLISISEEIYLLFLIWIRNIILLLLKLSKRKHMKEDNFDQHSLLLPHRLSIWTHV